MRKLFFALSAAMVAVSANAAVPVYAPKGTPITSPSRTYDDYLAPSSGVVWAYFLGKKAAYHSVISLKVNGITTVESPIFPNNTTPIGTKTKLGTVSAGDLLELVLTINAPGDVAGTQISSNRDNNTDGAVHIYATPYGGGDFGIPLGSYIYVGFEDIVGIRDANYKNDWDYDDHRFALRIAPVPEPATWAMMLGGFGLVGLSLRRRKTLRSVNA